MTGFAEVQFPPDISYGSSGGPEYTTDLVISTSGHEQRNVNWSQARLRYNVAKGVKNATQLAALIAFFRARKGRAHGFRFKDWSDFKATGETIGTGDGITTQFQLVKRYISGGVQETRSITKPVAGTVQVYKNAVLQTAGVSVSSATGLITFASAPANSVVITADFVNGRFGLFLPLPHPVQHGDDYSAVAGCDKRIDTCIARFANAVNFRGEPHLPGNDKILETSATRTLS